MLLRAKAIAIVGLLVAMLGAGSLLIGFSTSILPPRQEDPLRTSGAGSLIDTSGNTVSGAASLIATSGNAVHQERPPNIQQVSDELIHLAHVEMPTRDSQFATSGGVVPQEPSLDIPQFTKAKMDVVPDLETQVEDGEEEEHQETCICENIQIRGDDLLTEEFALGPDGIQDNNFWPGVIEDGDDGKTLGPLHNNTFNEGIDGDKVWTGYAFEVLCDVTGNPGACGERQVLKSTTVYAQFSSEECDELSGNWDESTRECTVHHNVLSEDNSVTEFPFTGDEYGLDNYTEEFDFKKHTETQIIWQDSPAISNATDGTTDRMEFIAIVKGSDEKYCYVIFEIFTQVRGGLPDIETIEVKDTKIGADSPPQGVSPF